jgi:Flp pilus assembly protein TadG
MSPRSRHRHNEQGAALLEMAISLPLLLLVAVGIFEFGRAYQLTQVLTNASREGARMAVLPGITDTAVKTRIGEYLDSGHLDKDAATVVIDHNVDIKIGATATANGSSVTLTYPLEFMVLQPVAQLVVNGSTVGAPLTLTASATMRNE